MAEVIWEYEIELLKGTTHQVRAVLDRFGSRGWELVTIIGSMAYFRKQRVAASDSDFVSTTVRSNGKAARV